MLGRRARVATHLCTRFPHLYVWHCSNHRLELAVGDVVKEVSGLNHFKIFFDKLYTLCHASPKNKRELCDLLDNMSFVFNLGEMYDALTELSDLSRLLKKRDMTLPEADKLPARQV